MKLNLFRRAKTLPRGTRVHVIFPALGIELDGTVDHATVLVGVPGYIVDCDPPYPWDSGRQFVPAGWVTRFDGGGTP